MWSIAEMTAHIGASRKMHAVDWKNVCVCALSFHMVEANITLTLWKISTKSYCLAGLH